MEKAGATPTGIMTMESTIKAINRHPTHRVHTCRQWAQCKRRMKTVERVSRQRRRPRPDNARHRTQTEEGDSSISLVRIAASPFKHIFVEQYENREIDREMKEMSS